MSSSVVDFDPPQEEPLEASSAVSRSDIGRWGSEGDESSQVDASVLEDSYVPSPPVTSHPAVISRPSKSFAGLRWDEAGQDAPASPLSPSARRMSSAPAGTAPLDLIPDASALSKPGVSQMATPGIVPQLMADAESVASEPSRHSFDCCSSKDTDPLPASPSRQQNQQRSAHLHAAGVQALVSGRMTPDGLRQSLQSWEGKSANSSPLKETLSVPPQRQEVLVWAVDTPDSSSTAQVLQGGANWHHKALSPELRWVSALRICFAAIKAENPPPQLSCPWCSWALPLPDAHGAANS